MDENILRYLGSPPKIIVENKDYNFSQVCEGEIINHAFEVKNNGGSVLLIKSVKSTNHGLIVRPLEILELNHDDTLKINIKFDTLGYLGHQERYLAIHSNDTIIPIYRLAIFGRVVKTESIESSNNIFPILKLEKTQHDFGRLEKNQIASVEIKILNVGNGILNIFDIKTSCGCTVASVSKRNYNHGESGLIKIDFNTQNRKNKSIQYVKILTNDPQNPFQRVTIFANIEE